MIPRMTKTQDTFARYRLRKNAKEADYLRQGIWRGKRLFEYVDAYAAAHANKIAIVDSLGTLTYGQFWRLSRNFAAGLSKLGVSRGDIVAIQSPNWRELPIAHFAANRLGAICVPIHDGFREHELSHLLKVSRAKVFIHPHIFHDHDHRALVYNIRENLSDLQRTIVMRAAPISGELGFDDLANDDSRTGANLNSNDCVECPSTEPLYIMVSSGTTGMPRCSVFCDDAVAVKIVQQFGTYSAFMSESDVAAAIAPAGTGATGYNYPVLGALLHGATSVMLERWSGMRPGDALRLLADHKCTYAVVIPTQLVKMVREARDTSFKYSGLRFITYAGAKLAPAVADEAEEIFGCPIQAVYGASDAGVPTMTSIKDSRERRRTVGRLVIGEEIKIIDPVGTALPNGEAGEICWRGANSSYGYLNSDEARKSSDDDWHYSGDLGRFNEDGYLEIVGRKKDMIIRGGRNINPGKIEEVLLTHDKVGEVAIIPIADELLGEIVCAVIAPSRNAPAPTLKELNTTILSAGMPVWYQPERLEVLTELPRNAGGKIDKRRLSETFSPKAAN